jgi:hypothetical protein
MFLLEIGLVVVMASLTGGCGNRPSVPVPAPASSTGPSPPPPTTSGITGKKYYSSIKKSQVDRVGSDEIRSEQQVVALLGEPTERSAARTYNNHHGTFTEYDLLWLKPEGDHLVKVTFLNGRKTTVIASVK